MSSLAFLRVHGITAVRSTLHKGKLIVTAPCVWRGEADEDICHDIFAETRLISDDMESVRTYLGY